MNGQISVAPWESALATFAGCVDARLPWMLVGSAATAVQGVAITPGDVDILVHPDTPDASMYAAAGRLAEFAAESHATDELATFASTREHPLLATDGWLFGRWTVNSCLVEVARIREPATSDLLLETVGRAVWEYRTWVTWRGQSIPVVPLEVQLATMISRGLDQRATAVRARLAEIGCRDNLIERAFADRQLQ